MTKYEQLERDLKVAVENAKRVAENAEDGGTCNFDSLELRLPRWNREKVKETAKNAGVGAWFSDYWKAFIISVPVFAQADRRTIQAEEMARTMKELGYSASVYYQID